MKSDKFVIISTVLACYNIFFTVCYGLNDDVYGIGVGIHDITGPIAEVSLFGYAKPEQTAGGLHTRQFSRAFIIEQNNRTIVFVNVDVGLGCDIVKLKVIERLAKLDIHFEPKDISISAIHTHSATGNYEQYYLYGITTKGFIREIYDAIEDGIYNSIVKAYKSMQQGYIFYNSGKLTDVSINRSPYSYLQNPESERNQYEHNTDKDMVLLKFVNLTNEPIGMLCWLAVHGTSMNQTNHLLSADNKGVAQVLFEQKFNPGKLYPLPNKSFVAAFANGNEGDSSPNTAGPKCQPSGSECTLETSSCYNKNDRCIAFGPGKDMFESTWIIGHRQYKFAWYLYNNATEKLRGPVGSISQINKMDEYKVKLNDTSEPVKLCKAALGYSFGAGTTDGPGLFLAQDNGNLSEITGMMNKILGFLSAPSLDIANCHKPKRVLLPLGEMPGPVWVAENIESQILRVGNLLIAAVPGEFTTMSGRRLKNAIRKAWRGNEIDKNDSDIRVVIAGLSNTYTHYIATYEEYAVQRYEGASTLFGPHTLEAYIQIFKSLTEALKNNETVSNSGTIPDLLSYQWSYLLPVVMDLTGPGKKFGEVAKGHNTQPQYSTGETVSVPFVCANPRNSIGEHKLDTFLAVEKQRIELENGKPVERWDVIATDANWETKFHWKSTSPVGTSECTIDWAIPKTTPNGNYRIRIFGNNRKLGLFIEKYTGKSDTFAVTNGTSKIDYSENDVMTEHRVPLKNFETVLKLLESIMPKSWK